MTEAEYRSVCPACEDSIQPGDPIVASQDGWRHRTCRTASSDAPSQPLCSDCYCYHAGECA